MPNRYDLVVVSNRLPVHRVASGGKARWEISPGGLVSALIPILEDRACAWIGWTGDAGRAPQPFRLGAIENVPVALSPEEVENYYQGFSNRTLWPLYHDAVRPPRYHRHWWRPYLAVNRRFAERAAATARPGATVWVHDYHLHLVPSLLRELRPDLRIGFFLHIPFPPQELFAQLPWRRSLLEGVMGADVVGFQTPGGARNFRFLAERYLDVARSQRDLQFQGRTVTIDAFPVSIDVGRFADLAASQAVREQAADFRRRLGSPRRVLLGVDRLDYTKGIDIRLRAVGELFAKRRITASDCVFVQLAVPSREEVVEYVELRTRVEELVGRINGEFGLLGSPPIHYLHRSVSIEDLVALYVAADVMVVTPLRDGMNLVAKEYVASRYADDGVLLLSEFTGAALQLTSALVVNPHDIDGLQDAMVAAIEMPPEEQERRMKAMRRTVRRDDVHAWATRFMEALAA
jgi:trehalose 6-phosphate synthase